MCQTTDSKGKDALSLSANCIFYFNLICEMYTLDGDLKGNRVAPDDTFTVMY